MIGDGAAIGPYMYDLMLSKAELFYKCRRLPVAAQVRAILPQFWGISGSTSTIFSTDTSPFLFEWLSL